MKTISNGTVTSPGGFLAGATAAGIKTKGDLDLGILYSEKPCAVAGRFTTNRIKAAPVLWCRECVDLGRAQAIVVNAGCANACTGEQGMIDTESMSRLAAGRLGLAPDDVLVASTGVIGERLPVDRIEAGVGKIALSVEGGHDMARAIMTTDTRPKEIAVAVDKFGFTVAGIAKGAGMIHPNMATMLAFLTTDANIDKSFLDEVLGEMVDATFNMVTVDGDTSPNDTVLLLANGISRSVKAGTEAAEAFRSALAEVCTYLARSVAADGEGATRLIEIIVDGASTIADARIAARTIAGSPLVKSAVHGCDPNWGRIIAALGRSGADFNCEAVELFLGGIQLMKAGEPVPFDKLAASAAMGGVEVSILVRLNDGNSAATAWGCDLSSEYVVINSEYTT
ncbi:MAG: bifunctional glutamate N-acetyltransferase/amino-acid acetyltransferase ArgJ [Chloroflexota bacterium]|nr:bifunctional glutamate N-acetyltransferase/amino-acid acetyltransferase ArgJ [Chloroflexota bacterium]